jgi:hypothetical protein
MKILFLIEKTKIQIYFLKINYKQREKSIFVLNSNFLNESEDFNDLT